MTFFSVILLFLTMTLSTGRNIFLKSVSDVPLKSKAFFIIQALIFFSGAIVLTAANGFSSISATTVFFSLGYALFLIMAQWNYTYALKNGNVGICAIVYSLGFIIPTIFGFVFWGESLTPLKLLGIILVIPAIIISGNKSGNTKNGNKYILPLIIAMIASGGLGVLQKFHQFTEFKNEVSGLILIAFLIAGTISVLTNIAVKSNSVKLSKKRVIASVLIGLCFSLANLLNTKLAGLLDSSVFFPVSNVGIILFSVFSGFLLFKEKLTQKTVIVLILGFSAIILINLG